MSLWQREQAFAGLASDGVTLVLRQGRAVLHTASLLPETEGVGAAALALDALLQQRASNARALRVVASDRYALYFVVSRMNGIRNVGELQSAVEALFESRFGERLDDWRVAFDFSPGAAAGVACALPRELVEGCVEAGRRAGIRSVSVLPHFVAAIRGRGQVRRGDAWFLVRGDGHVTLGRLQRDQWVSLRTMMAYQADDPDEVVAREMLRQGDGASEVPTTVVLGDWPGLADGTPLIGARRGRGRGATLERNYPLALAGVDT